MLDRDCVQFLQWALPRLRMRWPGFRKVRKQVCKRIHRRIDELKLADVAAYREYLEGHAGEWSVLDGFCRVTVSRFYRDRGVFGFLGRQVLPELCRWALDRDERIVRAWSAGCGSGEEPYTLSLLWELELKPRFPMLGVHILATEADAAMIRRAEDACYPASSLKDLPKRWCDAGFAPSGEVHCLRPEYKAVVEFAQHDLRAGLPNGPFDLILCRNLAFTYWDLDLQLETASRVWEGLRPRGALVIGAHETLPADLTGFMPWSEQHRIYVRQEEGGS
ncbi:MAG: chemotaxis protein CheR [Gemmatimonadales bacterium]|nr:chemotaxis protein CheR [Gemmatimonadales bacterium]NIN11356.1 chemotaxis protein CheR [Gemmatimonadales bacterium]NIN49966.1 chemotaxis protein CheR [Gemmatimonadales bacterium]NIP07430.1 chemotaxis protein CheR [Gemmatimonadales bacterium]NIR00497.1 chemotaxis protein CheR [Gemmatimonadales bacterium]